MRIWDNGTLIEQRGPGGLKAEPHDGKNAFGGVLK